MEKIVAIFLAFGVAWVVTPLAEKLAFAWGAVDLPGPRKVHQKVMPRLGGLAIYAAFLAGAPLALYPAYDGQPGFGLLAGATLIVLVGVIDDIWGLTPWLKLLGQALAAVSILPFGIAINFVTNPLNGELISLGWLGIPLTVFWIVAVTNAINLIDGLDGLAGGVSCIAALTVAAVGWTQWKVFGAAGQQEIIWLALLLAAILLAFLRYNFYPARIFLGDSGAMLLGFLLAAVSVLGLTKSVTAVSVFVPLVILGIPLTDTAFAILRRYHRRRPIFQPDRGHLHHLLLTMGFSHRQAVLVVYGISAVLGVSAIAINLISPDYAMILLLLLATAAIIGLNRIESFSRAHQARKPHRAHRSYDSKPTGSR
ncbi:MAG: undecaprenyl/decaprenyl-phosphate alpha-N-acetylglucosaminyl 1-phosphate transferase [Armatimonadetes bacterium]|nr:undecaprenyl/decaprenyl-phosphate alpha-N-acetylglucosaminyl 1-phosphate transferase [Armatimonadota bacterium]